MADLRSADIPLSTWLHFARQENGKLWRQKVYQAAAWTAPVFPRPNFSPPTQRAGPRRPDRQVRRNFSQTTQFCLEHLPERISDSSSALLAREHELGGRCALVTHLVQLFHAAYGNGWRDVDTGSLLAHLDSLPDWAECASHPNDLLILLLLWWDLCFDVAPCLSCRRPRPPGIVCLVNSLLLVLPTRIISRRLLPLLPECSRPA